MSLRLAAVAATALLTTSLLGVAVAKGPANNDCPRGNPQASATATATASAATMQRCSDDKPGLGRA